MNKNNTSLTIQPKLIGEATVDSTFANTYTGKTTATADVIIDNIDRTIAVNVNTNTIPTKKEIANKFSTKEDLVQLNTEVVEQLDQTKQDIFIEVQSNMSVFKSQICAELQKILGDEY